EAGAAVTCDDSHRPTPSDRRFTERSREAPSHYDTERELLPDSVSFRPGCAGITLSQPLRIPRTRDLGPCALVPRNDTLRSRTLRIRSHREAPPMATTSVARCAEAPAVGTA